MQVTIKHWAKGALERFYFNSDTGESIGYIAISGGQYNAKYEECDPVHFDYTGNVELIKKAIVAAMESFKTAGLLHNSDGSPSVSGDAFLMFASGNGAKNAFFSRKADMAAYKKIPKVYEVAE